MAGKWAEVQAEEGSPFKWQTAKLQTRKEPVIKSQSCYPTAGDPCPSHVLPPCSEATGSRCRLCHYTQGDNNKLLASKLHQEE